MIQILKWLRVKRGRGWRVLRVGGVVLVVVCLWAGFSHPTHTNTHTHIRTKHTHTDWSIAYDALQFPSPVTSSRYNPDPAVFLSRPQVRPRPLEEPAKIKESEIKEDEPDIMDPGKNQNINPRYNLKAVALDDIEPKLHRNRPFFRKKQLDIFERYEEEDAAKGRKNGDADDENVAIEEGYEENGLKVKKEEQGNLAIQEGGEKQRKNDDNDEDNMAMEVGFEEGGTKRENNKKTENVAVEENFEEEMVRRKKNEDYNNVAIEEQEEYEEDGGKRRKIKEDFEAYNVRSDKKRKKNEEKHIIALEEEEEDEDEYINDEIDPPKENNAALEDLDELDGKYGDNKPIFEDVGGEALKVEQKGRKKAEPQKKRTTGGDKGKLTKYGELQTNQVNVKHRRHAKRVIDIQNIYGNGSLHNEENNVIHEVQFPESLNIKEVDIDDQKSKRRNQAAKKLHSAMGNRAGKIVGEFSYKGERRSVVNPNNQKVEKFSLAPEKRVTKLNFGETDPKLDDTERMMGERRSRMRKVCARYGLGPSAPPGKLSTIKHPPTPNYDIFYIDRKDGLAWCPIYKAASTSWLYTFLMLAGISESYVHNTRRQVSHVARGVWPPLEYDEAEKAMSTCLKFMVVRHPFERLVSAFRDKLENTNTGREHGVQHFYQKYGRKIVAKYRKGGENGDLPSNRYSQDMDDSRVPKPKGIEPTFPEFVRYLIDTDLIYYSDDHWMPYYLHCTPCLVDYDVIAKFETLEQDQYYVIWKAGLKDKIKPSWKHLTKGRKTVDMVRKYFTTITKTELIKLYGKYKLDFELFGYSIDEYLDYVKSEGS